MAELTVTDLAKELQVSTSKLLRLTRAGRLPHLRIGRLIRYELEAVKAALRVETLQHPAHPGTSRGRLGRAVASPISEARVQQWRAEIRTANQRRRA
jgi:excisionase family DNA binding protein